MKNRQLLYPRVLHMMTEAVAGDAPKNEHSEDVAKIARVLLPDLQRAQRFVFESDGDVDPEIFKAVHFTTEQMIDAGFFHLPYPVTWIEDPWDYDKLMDGTPFEQRNLPHVHRKEMLREYAGLLPSREKFEAWGANLYLCVERANRIVIWGVTASPDESIGGRFYYHDACTAIDLSPDRAPNLDWESQLGGPMHAVKQFIVTLATKQAAVTEVAGKVWRPKCPIKLREYDYRTVEIRVGGQTQSEARESTGRKRKLELVRGYMYGKNTRALEQQRWVAPYWRGDETLGVSMRDHYEVKT